MAVEIFGDGKSWVRRIVDPKAFRLMRGLHNVAPFITPDHLTDLSTGIQLFLTFVQEEAHIANYELSAQEMSALGTLKAIVYSGDKLDGSMADVYDVEEPGKHDRADGGRYDARRDRQREGVTGLLRARTEYLKGSFLGEVATYAVIITAAEPSKARALVETLGYKPAEMGFNLLEALGTNGFRILFAEFAGLRTIGGIYIRPYVDLASSIANLYTAHQRMLIYEKYKYAVPPAKDEKERLERAEISRCAILRLADIEEVQRNNVRACVTTFVALRVGSLLQPEKS